MSTPKDQRPAKDVSEDIIQDKFNQKKYYEKTLTGEITTKIIRNSHQKVPPPGEPICTRSQMVKYYSLDGDVLALVHQYLRPDGTIGASGKPDPKRLYLPNEILFVPAKK
jgi:hypothetical protein